MSKNEVILRDSIDCENDVHDYPLPSGFIAASNMADNRLQSGWDNIACPDCGQFGWRKPE